MIRENRKLKLISLSILIIGLLIITNSLTFFSTKNQLSDYPTQISKSVSAQSTFTWTTTEVVSTESTYESRSPSLAADAAGNIHIAWHDITDYAGSGTDLDIFYKRWNSSTSLWTSTEVVSTESTDESWNPSLALDTAGNVHITWQDLSDYAGSGTDLDIFYKNWNSSTSLWTSTEVVSTESTGYSWWPSLAIDSAGNIHIAWEDQTNYAGAGTDVDIFYKRWDTSTFSWTTTEVVSTESTLGSLGLSLALDTLGNVHVAWEDGTDYAGAGTDLDIFYKRWNASTFSWTTTEVVSTESTDHSREPSLAVDSAGTVHIAWWDQTNYAGAGTDLDIFYKCWNASTSTWNTTEIASTESTLDSRYPSLATDYAGNVYLAWEDQTNYAGSGTDWDIFYKHWNATRSTWTSTEVISTESTGESWKPSLAMDTAGNVHIAWQDLSDYAGSGTDWDIFYKRLVESPVFPELAINPPSFYGFLLVSSILIVSFGCVSKASRTRRKKLT